MGYCHSNLDHKWANPMTFRKSPWLWKSVHFNNIPTSIKAVPPISATDIWRAPKIPGSPTHSPENRDVCSVWSSSRPKSIKEYMSFRKSEGFASHFRSIAEFQACFFVGFNIFGRWCPDIECLYEFGDGGKYRFARRKGQAVCPAVSTPLIQKKWSKAGQLLPFGCLHSYYLNYAYLFPLPECTCSCSWYQTNLIQQHIFLQTWCITVSPCLWKTGYERHHQFSRAYVLFTVNSKTFPFAKAPGRRRFGWFSH